MTRLISFLCLLVCYIHATSNEGGNTLLDDSEYQRLVKFDEMLEESVKSLASKKPEDFQPTSIADSVVLNYANVAMMYYQRNERWKQGGHAESLQYISLAIAAHSNANDAAHSDKTLYRSMMLHKARMLASLGRRKSALSILNALLEMYESNNADKNGDAKTSHWWTWYGSAKLKASSSTMSKQELSDVLYRKAELILTLFDDFQSAVDLFRRALESYPCHYLAHLQLIQALKATKSATREVWQAEIERMEEYLLNVRQRPRRTMKHVHKYSAPLIDYQQPIPRHDVNTIMDYSSIASILRSVHNNVHYLYDMLLAPTTEVVCTFSHSQSADSSSGLYAHISPVRTVTSLNSIHASLNWALFQAADSILSTSASTSGEEEEEDEEEVRGVAWKYLQQARHFDRLRINEQYEMQEYQQATLRGNEESEDREEDINKGGAPDLVSSLRCACCIFYFF